MSVSDRIQRDVLEFFSEAKVHWPSVLAMLAGSIAVPLNNIGIILTHQPMRHNSNIGGEIVHNLSDFITMDIWRRAAVRAFWMRAVHNAVLAFAGQRVHAILGIRTGKKMSNWELICSALAMPAALAVAQLLRSAHTVLCLDLNHGYPTNIRGVITAFFSRSNAKWEKKVRKVLFNNYDAYQTMRRPSKYRFAAEGILNNWKQCVITAVSPIVVSHPVFLELIIRGLDTYVLPRFVTDARRVNLIAFMRRHEKWIRAGLVFMSVSSMFWRHYEIDRGFQEKALYTLEDLPLVHPAHAKQLTVRGYRPIRIVSEALPLMLCILLEDVAATFRRTDDDDEDEDDEAVEASADDGKASPAPAPSKFKRDNVSEEVKRVRAAAMPLDVNGPTSEKPSINDDNSM